MNTLNRLVISPIQREVAFYIRAKDKAPMFFAGLAQANLDLETIAGDEFVAALLIRINE